MALLQWRRLAAGELDHEAIWLGVGAAGAVLVALGARVGLRFPRCTFHLATGYPCPGCGSTRAMLQLSHGHVLDALTFNPLTTVAAFAGAAWALYAATVLLFRQPRLRLGEMSPRAARGVRIGVFAAILANWGWVIAHGM